MSVKSSQQPQILKKTRHSEPSSVGKVYLIAYNGIQTLGWSYLLFQSSIYFLNRGTLDNFWQEIKWTLIIFQNAALLEGLTRFKRTFHTNPLVNPLWSVDCYSRTKTNLLSKAFAFIILVEYYKVLHAAIGLVPSSVLVVLMQVYSRVFLVGGVLLATEAAIVSPGLPICLFAWSVTEIIRYAYYGLNLVKAVPQLLLFLRYSTFLILYPVGITGELLCMYHSLGEIAEKQLYTISMPNKWNFIFNYQYFLIFYMALYIPLFPYLFGHMLSQRKKMLSDVLKKSA